MAKPPLLAWPVNWIRNICYELDLFCCTGKAVKNYIAVARVKALLCRSWLGLAGCPPPEACVLDVSPKPPAMFSWAPCPTVVRGAGASIPACGILAAGRIGKAYSFSLSSLVAGIRHLGPDSLANDGRSGTRWIASLWPLVPLTPCCLFVLCGGYNMFFTRSSFYLSAACLLL